MQWTQDADAKLFVHLITIHNVKVDYEALAKAMGNDCTAKSIMHRISRLRAMADEHSTAASAASPGLALPTHVKRASSSKARTPVSPAQPSPFGSYPASSVPMNVGKKATITKAAAATTTAAIGIKRGSSGKAKVAGSPLKEQMSVDEDADEEVETPSKKPKTSGLVSKKVSFADEHFT